MRPFRDHLGEISTKPGGAPDGKQDSNAAGTAPTIKLDQGSSPPPRSDIGSRQEEPTVRIAQIAPLYESVPPALYGGTERVVHYLTEELVAQGHDVTLFASGDSQTSATLVPMSDRALRLGGGVVDQMACHMRMIEEVYRRADDFDLLHFHIDYLHFPTSARVGAARVTTLHGRLDIPELG